MTDKYKSANNKWITLSLFLETRDKWDDASNCLYTLGRKDRNYRGVDYPSLYKLYLDCNDPTEWDFANRYLGGWEHWEKILSQPMLRKHVDLWRKELETKIRAAALINIQEVAMDPTNKNSFAANKLLLDRGWIKDTGSTSKRGRPSKAEIAEEAARIAIEAHDVDEDLARLNLRNPSDKAN